jgi:peptidoglycan L-alanyl-D-glutamate endopeptidase CwlK
VILNASSLAKLKRVHPDLVRVVNRCARDWKDTTFQFIITCGPRTIEEQRVLVAKGASKTMRSRHLIAKNGFSHAVDVAATLNGKVRWDWPLYVKIAAAMKAAAKAEAVPLEAGLDWKTFKDGPHYQLPWATHPGNK